MKKIIISGNKYYGLGKSLYNLFPDAKFCSRSNGEYDLTTEESMKRFISESLEYDLYISCSYTPRFSQTLLLSRVYSEWQKNKKVGQLIAVGSTADWSTKGMFYATEKNALRNFCRRMCGVSTGGGPNLFPGSNIRITYIGPGMMDLPRQREKHGNDLAKLNPDYVAETIKWITEQPTNINIHDICMDPIQYAISKD